MNQNNAAVSSGRLTIKLDEAQRARIENYVQSVAKPGLKASVASVVEAALNEFLSKRGV